MSCSFSLVSASSFEQLQSSDSNKGVSFFSGICIGYSHCSPRSKRRFKNSLRVQDDPDFIFQGAMDLCYLVPTGQPGLPELPTVSLVSQGAEMMASGDGLLYRVSGEVRGNDSVYCFTFGNSDLLGIEAYVIGHHHQQNVWMEFDLEKSRIGLAQVRCDLAGQIFSVYQ